MPDRPRGSGDGDTSLFLEKLRLLNPARGRRSSRSEVISLSASELRLPPSPTVVVPVEPEQRADPLYAYTSRLLMGN